MLRWIDTHCHLDAGEFAPDRDEVRERARRAGVAHCIIPAVETANFAAVRTLAHRHGDSYALGIHPMYTPHAREEDLALLDRMLRECRDDPRLVAVGEIGLDHFAPGLDAARQERFYAAQLEIARAHGLPVILHVRRSADALLKQLRRVGVQGIAHAFNGSLHQAREFLKLGFRLGFGGTVTYERAQQVRRLAAELPLSAIVLETDAPDMPPHWLYRTALEREAGRAQGRNEPAELPRIAAQLAPLRAITPEELAQATARNAADALPRLGALLAADNRAP